MTSVGVGRLLDLDRWAARFNQWIGATAMADKAAPGDMMNPHDPNAVVAALGEIERAGAAQPVAEEEDLPPFHLEPRD
jgi:hypothetical protein